MKKTEQRQRCAWAGNNSLMQEYHDQEWGVPNRDSRELWELLVLEGFQAGLSWSTILNKREAFREAFADFDPSKVAAFKEKDILRLLKNEGIIRSRAKIEAAIGAAKIYCDMEKRGEDFAELCWSFTGGKVLKGDGKTVLAETELSQQISKELKRRGFKFVGPVIVYAWMQAMGMVNDHSIKCFRRSASSDTGTTTSRKKVLSTVMGMLVIATGFLTAGCSEGEKYGHEKDKDTILTVRQEPYKFRLKPITKESGDTTLHVSIQKDDAYIEGASVSAKLAADEEREELAKFHEEKDQHIYEASVPLTHHKNYLMTSEITIDKTTYTPIFSFHSGDPDLEKPEKHEKEEHDEH